MHNFSGLWLSFNRTLIGILEVEPNDQRGRTATGSGQNSNEAVIGVASEAFARWLHH